MKESAPKTARLSRLFALVCLLFNYPMLASFNVRASLFGIPVLYLYLFVVWALVISLLAWLMRKQDWPCISSVAAASFAYIGLLFAVAYYADRRAEKGRSIIANPYFYSLSLAVYATASTFYGSIGRAAVDGVGFLPIYIGPTLMIVLWWFIVRKMIRISKLNRITSLAYFIASR